LYDAVDEKNHIDDKLLFRIEPLNYTLKVDLYSIQFDKNLEQIIEANKNSISIIDTAIINNFSPASLVHAVSSTKELTESFSTSYGLSQSFMESLSNRDEIGNTFSDSRYINIFIMVFY